MGHDVLMVRLATKHNPILKYLYITCEQMMHNRAWCSHDYVGDKTQSHSEIFK